jgi:hypothetical protein
MHGPSDDGKEAQDKLPLIKTSRPHSGCSCSQFLEIPPRQMPYEYLLSRVDAGTLNF